MQSKNHLSLLQTSQPISNKTYVVFPEIDY